MPQPVFRQFPLQQGSLSRATPLYNQPEEIFPYTKPFCPVCNETMEEWEEHLSPFGCDVSSNGKALRNQLWHKQSQKVLARTRPKHTNQKHPQFKVWNITGYLYHDKIESGQQIFYASLRRCTQRVTPNSVLTIEAAKMIMDLRFNNAKEYIQKHTNNSNWKKKLRDKDVTREMIDNLVSEALEMMKNYKNIWVTFSISLAAHRTRDVGGKGGRNSGYMCWKWPSSIPIMLKLYFAQEMYQPMATGNNKLIVSR
jgi:hypothetical protein